MTSSFKDSSNSSITSSIDSFDEFAKQADYSLMNNLNADPDATSDGNDHNARQVFSGHYVPVTPTPITNPEYVTHSINFFKELGLSDDLAVDPRFQKVFSGDLSPLYESLDSRMQRYGWATGYALSIYGTEYTHQCPFRTGNGYGDGRAISIFEGVLNDQRWEMQLKGGGTTPYCRGADGRAVLRSSVREFLAQEHMHALGVPTSRSLTLYTSQSETVSRPWYLEGTQSYDPDILVDNPVAISTRVAPSFLRVGQIELFARRVKNNAYDHALDELRMIVEHLIDREYKKEIDQSLIFADQLIELAKLFTERLTTLIANWLRVGFCQGNFNSDNCAAGGFTLDYGPFGFCEIFDPEFQPWTGGGKHFSFFNQPAAAEANFHMFWKSLRLLMEAEENNEDRLNAFDKVRRNFTEVQRTAIQDMWASKLGLPEYDADLTTKMLTLMHQSEVDYSLFFRELSHIPEDVSALKKTFYITIPERLESEWNTWLQEWRSKVLEHGSVEDISEKMKQINPKYTWREWLVVPAYQQAMEGNYELVKELQTVLSQPYDEQTKEIEEKYYRLKPKEFFNAGGVSHYSCSS